MKVFYVSEYGAPITGTPIVQNRGEAYIPTPVGGRLMHLDQRFVEWFDAHPPPKGKQHFLHTIGGVRVTSRGVTLEAEKSENAESVCLVHLQVECPGGRVELTANTHTNVDREGRIVRVFNAFPDAGVEPLLDAEDDYLLAAVPEAAEGRVLSKVELFMLMHPNSSFRVQRTGYLGSRSPELFVHWKHVRGRLQMHVDVPTRWRMAQDMHP